MKTAMKVEIVELYPINRDEERDFLTGTLRVKLPEMGIHILGIYFCKHKDRWHFIMPGRKGTHHMTGNIVRFPFIVFEDREKQDKLISILREKVPVFFEKRLKDTENPLVCSQKKKQVLKRSEPTIYNDTTPQKKTIFIEKPNQPITTKDWGDSSVSLKARNTSKFARR